MNQDPIEDLREIRKLMERSGKFMSVSGHSGIWAGVLALVGGFVLYQRLEGNILIPMLTQEGPESAELERFVLWLALTILAISMLLGLIFTLNKAKKQNQNIWTSVSKQLLQDFCIPLAAGGIFCLVLLENNIIGFLCPAMLCFYGLSLINASHKTIYDLRYLGYTQLFLACLNLIFLPLGFWFWCLGFGLVHILYGMVIYFKYER